MFCIITGSHYVRHYWACSELASSPSGGVVISSQSRFTLRVPPKESMLRHIRKSPRLIKPLIFCDAGALLNTIYRDSSARRRTQCVFYGETLLIRRKMTLSCGYGCCVVCACVCVCVGVLVWLVCSIEWQRVCVCVCLEGGLGITAAARGKPTVINTAF